MLSFDQLLSFSIGLAVLVGLVPLAVWFGTGRKVQAWRALQSYGGFLLGLLALAALGSVVGFIGAAFTS